MRVLTNQDIEIIQASRSIYDFTAAIYSLIDKDDNKAMGVWRKWKESEKGRKMTAEIDSFLSLDVSSLFEEHKVFLKEYLKLIVRNNDSLDNALIETTILCDELIGEQEISSLQGTKAIRGPMNNNVATTGISVYYKPPACLDDKVKKDNKLRPGGNISTVTKSSITGKINNMILLENEKTNGYRINIDQYMPSCDTMKDGISVGIAPVFNKPWFDMIKDAREKRFSIHYQDDFDVMNRIIINCIEEAFEKNVDFLVFPELLMNEHTYDEVDNYLRYNYDPRSNLKLIYLGSNWDDGRNVGYVLSAAGTVIQKVNKVNPYYYYDSDEKQEYEEALTRMDKKIYMIDIEGIGRISYSICRDGLLNDVVTIKAGYLESNIEVISSYTAKTGNFISMAKSSAESYFRTNILCNSCAAITKDSEKNAAGFVGIPYVNNKEVDCRFELSYKDVQCETCGDLCNGCIKVFDIRM